MLTFEINPEQMPENYMESVEVAAALVEYIVSEYPFVQCKIDFGKILGTHGIAFAKELYINILYGFNANSAIYSYKETELNSDNEFEKAYINFFVCSEEKLEFKKIKELILSALIDIKNDRLDRTKSFENEEIDKTRIQTSGEYRHYIANIYFNLYGYINKIPIRMFVYCNRWTNKYLVSKEPLKF